MPLRNTINRFSLTFLVALCLIIFVTPTEAFGAGYVARGSLLKATKFRHGDIALAIPLLSIANRRLVKQIYFGNWLRDFSQLLDKSSLSLVPYPVLRALVAVFAFVQFGYATREFEVTDERLGFYRPEEHADNPKGYDSGAATASSTGDGKVGYPISEGLRPTVHPTELDIDPRTGMKNYIANSPEVGRINPTSADYVEKQLIAAIACGRQGDEEAYIHLGAAMHTLEDFAAHSNYVELAMQMIGSEIKDRTKLNPTLEQVFAFVGGDAKVDTAQGTAAAPIVTGTFGALDLYQTLLGEIDDKLSAMSLPGLQLRTSDSGGPVQKIAKYLISLLGGLTPDFETDILKIQKAAADPRPATWGDLDEQPEKLWESLEPVFKLRDDVVKWVYDHLAIRAVQDALAAISTAIDKLVYTFLGIFLRPLLTELSISLKQQQQALLKQDQEARLAAGEASIFSRNSTATDPTHSQLAKDHYEHVLNEIAGRVAVRVSAFTVTTVIQLWQPGNTADPQPAIQSILAAFHHPFNASPDSPVQRAMLDEIRAWIRENLSRDPVAFEIDLRSLSREEMAERMDVHSHLPGGHTHVDVETVADDGPEQPIANARFQGPVKDMPSNQIVERVLANIERQVHEGAAGGLSMRDLPAVKEVLFADPSGESPNPLDAGLAKCPGVGLIGAFEGVEVSEIAATEGMGEMLKDGLVSLILLDESRGPEEEVGTVRRLRFGRRTEVEREEVEKLKALRSLLTLEKREGEGNGEVRNGSGKGAEEKLRAGFERLKLRAQVKGVKG